MNKTIKALLIFFYRWACCVVALFVVFAIVANVTVMTLEYFNPFEWDNKSRCTVVLFGCFIAFVSMEGVQREIA
ncbi:hypothetical protein [Vibrio alginolyticus]|uniref:hypothetical protein n=1 Tax=Vibrio alginolyticus TaxID=663 RepID=UPI000720741B|nr:hypothetical protein [Vibrio alginolyticus]ALR94740.1 hypothetical protein AT730_20770 [Vibrio alginolyticus]MBY7706082.1 hypothetical protein [Vibrio alginolyticus]